MRKRTGLPRVELLEDRKLLATITVNTVTDLTPPSGAMSLRLAIQVADGLVPVSTLSPIQQSLVRGSLSDPDTINFDIAGSGVDTIRLQSSLPEITVPMTINGYSQPGSSPNTLAVGGDNARILIELDGEFAGPVANGLVLSGGNSTVEGLAINRFGNGLLVPGGPGHIGGVGLAFTDNAGGNVVWGNFIGTDPTGMISEPNGVGGVLFRYDTGSDTLGGAVPAARNIIGVGSDQPAEPYGATFSNETNPYVLGNYIGTNASGAGLMSGQSILRQAGLILINVTGANIGGPQSGAGNVLSSVNIQSNVPTAGNNLIRGNFLGVNATGTHAIPVAANLGGVSIMNSIGNVIGGTAANSGNVIAFPGGDAVLLQASNPSTVLSTTVQGNHIGTDLTGTVNFGDNNGVTLLSSGNSIGGLVPGAGNVIAFSASHAINIPNPASTGNVILSNIIYGTGQSPIAVASTGGVSAATISAVYPVATGLMVQGLSFTGAANTAYTVQVFANAAMGASGLAEGKTYLGSVTVRTDATGKGSASPLLPVSVSSGQIVTATVTGASGNTTGFAPGIAVLAQPRDAIAFSASSQALSFGQSVTLTAAVSPSTLALGMPAGIVEFMDGSRMIGAAWLDPNGRATMSTSSLGTGVHALSAVYMGDARFTGLLSSPVVVTVKSVAPAVVLAHRGGPTSVLVSYSQAMSLATTGNSADYHLIALRNTSRGLVPFGSPITVKKATYNPTNHSVTLTPSIRLNPRLLYRLTIVGVTDVNNTPLAGGSFVGMI